jgi:hypothetical protein
MALRDAFATGAQFAGGAATADGMATWSALGLKTVAFFRCYIRRPPF